MCEMAGQPKHRARAVIELSRATGRIAQRLNELVPSWVDRADSERFCLAPLWKEVRAAALLFGLKLDGLAKMLACNARLDETEAECPDFERFVSAVQGQVDLEGLDALNLLDPPDPYDGDVEESSEEIERMLLRAGFLYDESSKRFVVLTPEELAEVLAVAATEDEAFAFAPDQ
jgi:hypothetical protein